MKGFENLANPTMIKPSSPTPHGKRCVKLSLVDQQLHFVHTKLLIIYSPAVSSNPDNRADQGVVLKTSLSEILTKFYPYAGRIKDNSSIECTDEGVVYTEAEVDSDVVSVVHLKHDPSMFDKLWPVVDDLEGLKTIPLLIQANFFIDGGLALGFLASHRIMDGVGLSNFIRSWAITAAAFADDMVVEGPDFTIPSSLYPPSDLFNSISKTPLEIPPTKEIYVTKKYIFENSSIAKFKARLGTNPQPTRVEAVTALIWKCAIKTSRASIMCSKTSSLCVHSVNTRKRWMPPLPDNTPGNHIGFLFAQKVYSKDNSDANDKDDYEELGELVYLLKDGLRVFCDTGMKKMQDASSSIFVSEEHPNPWTREDVDVYCFSSWCGFKLYDADFGWGKPDLIIPSVMSNNLFILMDTKDGNGIEAWINHTEQDMGKFQEVMDMLLVTNSQSSSVSNP